MRRYLALLAPILLFILIWQGSSALALPIPGAPAAAVEKPASGAVTFTVYLPLIAKPAPTIPYVLTKIKLPAGSHPHGIALDLDGRRAFVGNHDTNSLSVIDTQSLLVTATIPLPSANGPNGVAYHAGTDRVYVANRDSHNLSIVDPSHQAWIANRAVGTQPDGVIAAGDLIYVANFGSNSVSILSAQTGLVSSTLAIGVEPSLFTQLENSNTVFLSAHGNNTIYFLQHGTYVNSTPGITAPYGLAIDQITHRLYVANRGEARTTTLLDVEPNSIKGALDVGHELYVVGVNSRTGHVFVSLGDRVNVYDRRDNALITSIPVGIGADEGLAVDPERGLIYVTSRDTDEVTVIQDIPTYDIAYLNTHVGYIYTPPVQTDLLLMDDTGRHTTTLHLAAAIWDYNTALAWRPDGKRLAYTSYRDHTSEIYAVDLLGNSEVNLTNSPATRDEDPAWSPDGSKIAWSRDNNIWVMNSDGSQQVQLTSVLAAWRPHWSPDGQWLSFTGVLTTTAHDTILLVPAGGGSPIDVVNDPTLESFDETWSPASDEIAFIAAPISGTFTTDVYKLNIHTLARNRLTNVGDASTASWSPDGAHIAYFRPSTLYVMDPDGGQVRSLIAPVPLAPWIAWSADSQRIATQGDGDLNSQELYLIDVATGAATRLTDNTSSEGRPLWRPDTWK